MCDPRKVVEFLKSLSFLSVKQSNHTTLQDYCESERQYMEAIQYMGSITTAQTGHQD